MNPNLKIPTHGMTLPQTIDFIAEQIDRLNVVLKNLDGLNLKRVDFNLVGGGFIRLDRKGYVINDGTEDVLLVDTAGNITITGTINALAGLIGGWTIENDRLTGGVLDAGKVLGTTIIGSEIMTAAPGVYPRAVMSTSSNLIKAEASSSEYVSVESDNEGRPAFRLHALGIDALLRILSGSLLINTVFGSAEIQLNSGKDLQLNAETGYKVKFESWDKMYSATEAKTLKDELDAIKGRLNNLESDVNYLNNNAFVLSYRDGSYIVFDAKDRIDVDATSVLD